MYRTAPRVGLFAALLLGLMTAVLTPDTGLAHDVDACRGHSWLVHYSGEWYHFSNTSVCPEDWGTIVVATVLIRPEGLEFTIETVPALSVHFDDSLASVKGFLSLTDPGRCYINVGLHFAVHVHPYPPRHDEWVAASFSPPVCT